MCCAIACARMQTCELRILTYCKYTAHIRIPKELQLQASLRAEANSTWAAGVSMQVGQSRRAFSSSDMSQMSFALSKLVSSKVKITSLCFDVACVA